MDNKTIRIALIGVIVFLIYRKMYLTLSKLFLLLSIKFHIYNENILLPIHVVIGILSLLFLLFISHKLLKDPIKNSSILFISILLLLVVHTCLTLVNVNYKNYLNGIGIEHFQKLGRGNYIQESWIKMIEVTFPILGLFYFLFKLKKQKNGG